MHVLVMFEYNLINFCNCAYVCPNSPAWNKQFSNELPLTGTEWLPLLFVLHSVASKMCGCVKHNDVYKSYSQKDTVGNYLGVDFTKPLCQSKPSNRIQVMFQTMHCSCEGYVSIIASKIGVLVHSGCIWITFTWHHRQVNWQNNLTRAFTRLALSALVEKDTDPWRYVSRV